MFVGSEATQPGRGGGVDRNAMHVPNSRVRIFRYFRQKEPWQNGTAKITLHKTFLFLIAFII
jgi:hypothetical protein